MCCSGMTMHGRAYVNVKSKDGILLAGPLQARDLCLKLVLRLPLLRLMRWSTMVSRRAQRPAVLFAFLSLAICLNLLRHVLLCLWLPLLWLLLLTPATAWPVNALHSAHIAHSWWRQVFATDVRIAEALPRSLGTAGPW